MMKRAVLFILAVMISFMVPAQEVFPLWPDGGMPNSKGLELEYIEERQRVMQVSQPSFHAFFPPEEEQNGTSVLIIPSGGYHHLTYDMGGFQIAKWFNVQGIAAFVLFYRLPNSPDLKRREQGPVQDAQRAMKLIRANAEKWNLKKDQIGVFGSSAGGHLATTIGTKLEDFCKVGDSIDNLSYHPDFMILVSPVISLGKYTHKGSAMNFLGRNAPEDKIEAYSNQFNVNSNTPPSFLAHAQNDKAVDPMNSILFYQAMMKENIVGSLHIFPKGGHNIGIFNASGLTDRWKSLCVEWLKEINLLK